MRVAYTDLSERRNYEKLEQISALRTIELTTNFILYCSHDAIPTRDFKIGARVVDPMSHG